MGNLHKELARIQLALKAPKSQRNNFGNYNYRSTEDITEAVKLLLNGNTLTLSDELVLIGDRYYIKATATISDGKDIISSSAYAREAESQKGMAEAQITGSSSSYARKYALNGLFAIDDTKDADHDNTITPPADYKAKLAVVKNTNELKKVWSVMPNEEKEKHIKLKEELKMKYENL